VSPSLLALFAVSGATGLIYEVLWTRALGLVFGHTVFAITTVLAAFMLGLSLGSALFARWAHRVGSPLRLYAALEAGIALSALAVPPLIAAVAPLTRGLVAGEASTLIVSLSQFGLVLPILLPPTVLMGGTLPVLVQLTGEGTEGLGSRAGSLYAANTLGAVAGVAAAGFVLLPAFGNRGTGRLAVAANLTVAAMACLLSRGVGPAPADLRAHPEAVPPGEKLGHPIVRRVALASVAISGAIAMACEAAWVRALSLVIGSSTYAFTAMLLAYLLGIGLGSAAYAARAPRPSLRLLSGIQLGAAGGGALALLAFRRMPDLFLLGFAISDSPGAVQALQVGLCILTLLPTTLALGATFPCAVALASRRQEQAAGAVGRPYALNTLGAILGTLLAGFVTIPALGAEGTLRAAVASSAALAVFLLAWDQWVPGADQARELSGALPRRRTAAAAMAGAVAVATIAIPAWDRRVLTSGVAIYGNTYLDTPGGLPAVLAGERLLYYRDGLSATVSVHANSRGRFLRINGKTDASTGDMPTQLMAGHLPLLLHPAPQDVFVLGLASGATAGAVLQHPVRRLDVVEIEPAMVEAAAFFAPENREALRDPRLRLHIADARQFLLATPRQYDVIVAEPSNPWIGGIATLFTKEFFTLARSRLRPGGIMLQWVHGYALAPEDMRMVVRTFREVFPFATLWGPTGADYLLVGTGRPLELDLASLGKRVAGSPTLRQELEGIGFRAPEALLADFLLDEKDLARYAGVGPLNADDRLPLEFSAPLSLYRETVAENRRGVLAARQTEFPHVSRRPADLNAAPIRYTLAVPLLGRGQYEEALAHLERALTLDPRYPPARLARAKVFLVQGRAADAKKDLEAVLAQVPGNAEAAFTLGSLHAAHGDTPQAAVQFQRAVAKAPQNVRYRAGLASLYLRRGEFARAAAEYQAALALAPEDPGLREGLEAAQRGAATTNQLPNS
jgi:spermidine synthase